MDHLAQRCGVTAAAALAAAGLVAGLTSMSQPLADVQIRDFDLSAINVDTGPAVETVENHVRPDLAGTGDGGTAHVSLGDVLWNGGNDDLLGGGSESTGELTISDELAKDLAGGGLDTQALQQGVAGVLESIEAGVVGGTVGPTTTSVLGGTEQAMGAAAATLLAGLAVDLPLAYQSLTAAVAAMEAQLNSALVEAQLMAAERLFGDSPEANEAVNWIFSINNTLLAQNESAFNSLFGIPFDAHTSLLGHFEPGLADADWSTLFGLSPTEFTDVINAIQAENMTLLGSIDWADLFGGLFGGLF